MAAKHLKPIVMELSDQSPAIILDDANLIEAAQGTVQSAMVLHDRVCSTTERIIVHSAVKDEFYRHLTEAVRKLPSMRLALQGQDASTTQKNTDAINNGAKFLIRSSEMTSPAAVAPSILTDVNPKAVLYANEKFVRTASATVEGSDEQAIEEANWRDGGLSAIIFTGSYERGLRMAKELEFGMVQINTVTPARLGGPATSVKGSGWGRHGVENFLHYKSISFAATNGLEG
ncbi:hypothetical protein ACJ41O_014300 [Fusarium nematophilum]